MRLFAFEVRCNRTKTRKKTSLKQRESKFQNRIKNASDRKRGWISVSDSSAAHLVSSNRWTTEFTSVRKREMDRFLVEVGVDYIHIEEQDPYRFERVKFFLFVPIGAHREVGLKFGIVVAVLLECLMGQNGRLG